MYTQHIDDLYLIQMFFCNGDPLPYIHLIPIERQIRSSPWERNFVFPLCFLVLLGMTVLALFIVTANTLELLYHQASVISVQVSVCEEVVLLAWFGAATP